VPDGATFTTLEELQTALAVDPRLAQCAARRLFSYAIGREPSCLSPGNATGSVGLKDLVSQVLHEPAFAYRRGQAEGDTL